MYVTFACGEYNISEIVETHPERYHIFLAASGPLEKHWSFYPQHNSVYAHDMIEELELKT